MSAETREKVIRAVRVAAPLAVVMLIGFAVWKLAGDTGAQRREAAPVPVVALTPPPPPPAPPKPAEPDKTVETPTPTPEPKAESPKTEAPQQLTINGPPQAGGDSFGVAAGNGGGTTIGGDPNGSGGVGGGAFGEAAYKRLLSTALQEAIQSDDQASRLFFTAQVRVWVSSDGRISNVTIARSSGDTRMDRTLVAALMGTGRLEEAPPTTLKFPALVAVRGRKA